MRETQKLINIPKKEVIETGGYAQVLLEGDRAVKKIRNEDRESLSILSSFLREKIYLDHMKKSDYVINIINSGPYFIELERGEEKFPSKSEIKKFISDTLTGIKDLHERGLLHADINKYNVIYVGDRWKIIDLGLSVLMHFPFSPIDLRNICHKEKGEKLCESGLDIERDSDFYASMIKDLFQIDQQTDEEATDTMIEVLGDEGIDLFFEMAEEYISPREILKHEYLTGKKNQDFKRETVYDFKENLKRISRLKLRKVTNRKLFRKLFEFMKLVDFPFDNMFIMRKWIEIIQDENNEFLKENLHETGRVLLDVMNPGHDDKFEEFNKNIILGIFSELMTIKLPLSFPSAIYDGKKLMDMFLDNKGNLNRRFFDEISF